MFISRRAFNIAGGNLILFKFNNWTTALGYRPIGCC